VPDFPCLGPLCLELVAPIWRDRLADGKVRAMMNSTTPVPVSSVSAAKRQKLLGIQVRYWRIGVFCGVAYSALLVGINLFKHTGRWEPQLGAAAAGIIFGISMGALLAYFERKALSRLDIDADAAYDAGVFDTEHSLTVSLDLSRDDALQRAEDALVEYGAVIEKRDVATGTMIAFTAQNWRSYGEKLIVVASGAYPCEVTISASPRVYLLKFMTNYGRSWEQVQTLAARMRTGSFPMTPGGKITPFRAEVCGTPPSVMEAGAWQRLIVLLALYSMLLLGAMKPGKTLIVASAFALGLLLELAAFVRYRRQVRDKQRSESQETVEAMLNNLWPAVFAPALLVNPSKDWTDGNNIAAIAVAGAFSAIAFNRLREKKREQMQRESILASREKAELQRQLAEAKLVALSAQIEPHFLFNTLASIQYLIRNDAVKAADMTGDLIRYLRLALPRMKQSTARLADELDLVRAYLGVMQIRMGTRLRFDVDQPGALADCEIPTMALITLVENAIKHGLEQKADGGTIHVAVAVEDETLRLQVADTGGGFSTAASGTGIGLANIRERLDNLYGNRASLALEANQPSGVKAILTIPKEKT
jgi:signal transduction histidine kinase